MTEQEVQDEPIVPRRTDVESENFQAIFIPPQPRGRRLILFAEGTSAADMAKMLKEATATEALSASMAGSESGALRLAGASGSPLIVEQFAVAAVGGGTERAASAANILSGFADVEDTRPEFWMFALSDPPWEDTAAGTWGLDAVNALQSSKDGSGIKLAVLDTGIDLGHPDFAGRTIVAESFVPNETVDDVQGHGTHCCGTAACAALLGNNLPGRYGVAPGVQLHMGKVLNNRGSGREIDIIAGMEWAVGQGCEVISMSLGRATMPNEPFDPAYERIANIALNRGSLIIAAAGNESDRRYGYIAPVGAPANSPSILAVAAIGSDGGVASFSSGGVGTGAVDVCGPGVAIFSSVPRPQLYKKLGGTSMATPHVAGIAALWAQADPASRGRALWEKLMSSARPINGLPVRDIGAGLVQSPP
jgi:subtilisin